MQTQSRFSRVIIRPESDLPQSNLNGLFGSESTVTQRGVLAPSLWASVKTLFAVRHLPLPPLLLLRYDFVFP